MDYKNKKCLRCKKGKYIEMNIHDDIHNTVTCNKCGDWVYRYTKKNKNEI